MVSKRLNTVVELLEIFPFIDKFAKINRLTSKFKIVYTQVFIVRCQKCVKSNCSLKIPNQIYAKFHCDNGQLICKIIIL